jgi:5-methylcytosine-specific restriction enzyme A
VPYLSPPNWTRDELILALDLYFKTNFVAANASFNSKSEPIRDLSELLNSLPIHDRNDRGTNFRNPAGVYMKLSNFLPFDPGYNGVGLTRGGKLDKVVWDEFSNDTERLDRTAKAIREGFTYLDSYNLSVSDEDEFAEGRILTRLHKAKERSSRAVKAKKAAVLKATGKLECEVCSFDFRAAYGELGRGYAECHHTTPISSLSGQTNTRLADLAIVCANCHRMIHHGSESRSIAELKSIIARVGDSEGSSSTL